MYFTLVRKRGVICAVAPKLLCIYRVFTRHLNMECFESAVPAIFLSYALSSNYPIYTNIAYRVIFFLSNLDGECLCLRQARGTEDLF